jgi:hypothetical protein
VYGVGAAADPTRRIVARRACCCRSRAQVEIGGATRWILARLEVCGTGRAEHRADTACRDRQQVLVHVLGRDECDPLVARAIEDDALDVVGGQLGTEEHEAQPVAAVAFAGSLVVDAEHAHDFDVEVQCLAHRPQARTPRRLTVVDDASRDLPTARARRVEHQHLPVTVAQHASGRDHLRRQRLGCGQIDQWTVVGSLVVRHHSDLDTRDSTPHGIPTPSHPLVSHECARVPEMRARARNPGTHLL